MGAAVLASPAGDAHANGRFPESNALFFAPSDPDYLLLRVSFGAIVSRNHGRTWGWVCERVVGTSGTEDPMYAITPNGTAIGATSQGLAISHDKECSFAFTGGELDKRVFIDLTQRPFDKKSVVSFTSSYDKTGDGGVIFFKSQLYETLDEGQSWQQLGPLFDPTLLGETVDVTATDPDRIYVSAVRDAGVNPKAVVLVSRDRGKSYEESPIQLENGERAAYIAGVDPTNADRIYIRTENGVDAPSRLLVSEDGAKTFRLIFTANGPLRGFALSADGQKIYAGSPRDGVNIASVTDFAFHAGAKIPVQCLATSPDGVWACASEPAFILGLSKDDGMTFESKLHFCEIAGPLECPADSPTSRDCPILWPAQRDTLGCNLDAGDDAGTGAAPPPSSNCGCRIPASSPWGPVATGVVALLGLAVLRRRK